MNSTCNSQGPQVGIEDLRLRLVMDDGISNAAIILARASAEEFLEMSMDDVKAASKSDQGESFLADLRSKMIGRKFTFTGRAMIDGQGALLMADSFKPSESDLAETANKVREQWGVFA